MATNPIQKKSRISFFLGMLLMFIIAAVIVAFLYMKIKNQQEEIKQYKLSTSTVYVLSRDVKSGQVLTPSMFTTKQIATTTIPSNATTNVATTLASYSLSTKNGMAIYYHQGTPGNVEDPDCYHVGSVKDMKKIYKIDSDGKEVLATNLKKTDKAYYYAGQNNTQKTDIEISENAVIAKVDLNANTVITTSLIARGDVTSNDLRREEYNVISLPVDLAPGEYVDVRLTLPNGQNYIVVSKKEAKIPVVNGQYLADTIQMNLTEEEIMIMSGAIVENYKNTGSKLYATRYTEAGLQEAATMTYYPSKDVQEAIKNDPNVVIKAIQGILQNRDQIRKDIDATVSKYETEESIQTKVESSITSTQEQRKNYLQTLPVTQ